MAKIRHLWCREDDVNGQIDGVELPVRCIEKPTEHRRGLMFRFDPPEHALYFDFDAPARRFVHMLFVPFALDAVFVRGGYVRKVVRLRPWVGVTVGRADALLELPPGTHDLSPGDRLALV